MSWKINILTMMIMTNISILIKKKKLQFMAILIQKIIIKKMNY